MQRGAHLGKCPFDQGALEGGLVGQVLIDRRGANAQLVGDVAHRQRVGPLGLEQCTRGGDDVRGACRSRHAVSSRMNTGCLAAMRCSSS